MHRIARICTYALLVTGSLITTGCVVEPEHERVYERRDGDYRAHERREAYEHCREAGGHDCDDILHR